MLRSGTGGGEIIGECLLCSGTGGDEIIGEYHVLVCDNC